MGYSIQAALEIIDNQGGPKQKVIIGKSTISLEDIPVNLIYVPVYGPVNDQGVAEYELNLCWEMVIHELSQQNVYHFIVDARTGETLSRSIGWLSVVLITITITAMDIIANQIMVKTLELSLELACHIWQ